MSVFIIVAVDDDPKILKMIERSLSSEECRVITVKNAELGMSVLQQIPTDMVISDYILPGGMSGLVFLENVRRSFPDVLTVLQTGFADLRVAIEAINTAGVCKLIEKPWQPVQLAEMIKSMLESRRIAREKEDQKNKAALLDAELKQLEQWYPGITSVKRDADGYIAIPLPVSDADEPKKT
jgi:DNA-binding NtrC family response regulator